VHGGDAQPHSARFWIILLPAPPNAVYTQSMGRERDTIHIPGEILFTAGSSHRAQLGDIQQS